MNRHKLILTAIIAFSCLFFYGCSKEDKARGPNSNNANILVTRVVDGDTLVLEGGQRVRLIGIDTPETHVNDRLYLQAQRSKKDIQTIIALGKEAYKFTRNLVEGKRVRIEFDLEKYDKYGRLLCYVYLEDGTFVNDQIIRQGHASLLTIPPNVKYVDLFRTAYEEARENNRGLWAR
ncbi:MAG: thermonuclease family protein [Candidatus Omnitrophota bacterium]